MFEGIEIVMDVLDLGPARHGEAEPAEQVDQFVGGLGQRMTVAQPGPVPGSVTSSAAAATVATFHAATWRPRGRPRGLA